MLLEALCVKNSPDPLFSTQYQHLNKTDKFAFLLTGHYVRSRINHTTLLLI